MKKPKIVTILLLLATISLMGAIFYIASILTSESPQSPPIAPVKTRAQSRTYNRMIALNPVTQTPTPPPTSSPTATMTPTPTEIILAYTSPTPTGIATASPTVNATSSATPTKTETLPSAGYLTHALIIFAAAGLLIFFAFIF